MTVVSVAAGHAREAVVEHQRTDASLDELTLFLARLTGLLLRSSGEGAELIEDSVRSAARSLGGEASLLLVPDAAALTVTAGDGTRTVTVRGFPRCSASTR